MGIKGREKACATLLNQDRNSTKSIITVLKFGIAVTFMSKYLIQDEIAQKNQREIVVLVVTPPFFSQFSIIACAYSNSIDIPDLVSKSGTSAYQVYSFQP